MGLSFHTWEMRGVPGVPSNLRNSQFQHLIQYHWGWRVSRKRAVVTGSSPGGMAHVEPPGVTSPALSRAEPAQRFPKVACKSDSSRISLWQGLQESLLDGRGAEAVFQQQFTTAWEKANRLCGRRQHLSLIVPVLHSFQACGGKVLPRCFGIRWSPVTCFIP